MSRYNDELKLKLAWQSALEQRTCPGSNILYAESIDDNLQKHLSFCEVCRENRAMQFEEKTAWQGLLDKMSGKAIQPASDTAKQEGQVWTLKKELGKWQRDGRYFQPPMVLLLSKVDNVAAWRVAQLYEDKRLMGSGDVPLDDRFGFAESWNCYDLKETSLGLCFGCVKQDELSQVLAASTTIVAEPEDGSVQFFFRSLESEVSKFIESQTRANQPAKINVWLEEILGSISNVRGRVQEALTGWKPPDTAETVFDLLAGSELEETVGFASDSESMKTINLVSAEAKGLLVGTLTAVITADDQLDDGTYFISGRLKETAPETLYLLARLVSADSVWETERITIKVGTKAFSIKFKDVPTEVCTIENVRMILVNP